MSLSLRGVAILMVVFSHFFEWREAFKVTGAFARFMTFLGDPGVAVFFFLSGYALFSKYKDKPTDKEYIYKRFKNMYFPYLLIAVLIALIAGSLKGLSDVWRILTGKGFWFITIILIIYIAFYFVGKLPKFRILAMAVIITALSVYLYLKDYREFWYNTNWCFVLGMIIAGYETSIIEKLGLKGSKNKGKNTNPVVKFLSLLGRYSLYIYLLHNFVFYRVVSFKTSYNTPLGFAVKILISLVITVLISDLFRRFVTFIFALWETRRTGEKNN